MLKLLCNVKCGYFDKYMSESNFSFNLSFLAKAAFFNRMNELVGNNKRYEIYSEEELFNMYHDNPIALVKEYDLGPILLNAASSSFALRYFPEVLVEKTKPVIFPEVFKIDGYQLILTDEPDALGDNMFDFLEELEKELKQDELDNDSSTINDKKTNFDA